MSIFIEDKSAAKNITRLLLRYGADPDKVGTGKLRRLTPFKMAALSEELEALQEMSKWKEEVALPRKFNKLSAIKEIREAIDEGQRERKKFLGERN